MLHHACEPTHPEPTSQDTLQTSDPKIFISHIPVLNFARTDYTHVCQPWTNVPKIHHKTSDPKIFISHIRVLNFAGAALHTTPHMWANPSWTNVPRDTTNFRSEFCHLTHLFWTLPEQLPMLHHTCEPTHPEPTSQDTLQTSDPKIFISHIPVLNFAGTTRNRLHHACVPTHPEPTFQRHVTKPQTPRFSSHTPLSWTLPEQLSMLHHTREPTHPEPTSQDTLQTSGPIFFISPIPVLNFAGIARHVTPRMWANPSCTNVPRYTTNH